jgi:hypothetical protein
MLLCCLIVFTACNEDDEAELGSTCASPMVWRSADLPLAGPLEAVRTVWAGGEGVVAFAVDRVDHVVIFLGRFSADGALVGSMAVLGGVGAPGDISLGLASNGSTHVLCASHRRTTGKLACWSTPVGAPEMTRVSYTIGDALGADLAHGPNGFLLAHAGGGRPGAHLTSLDEEGRGPEIWAPRYTFSSAQQFKVVGTDSGYVLAFTAQGTLMLSYVDALPSPGMPRTVRATHDLVVAPMGLAASGDRVAVMWSSPTAVMVAVADTNHTITAQVLVDTPVPAAGTMALTAGNQAFVASWTDVAGALALRSLDDHGGILGSPLLAMGGEADGVPQAITSVPGGFVLASASSANLDGLSLWSVGCEP